MKALKFTAGNFTILTPDEQHRIRDCGIAADFANQIFNKWLKELESTMRCFTQGISLLEEEEFRELFDSDYIRADR